MAGSPSPVMVMPPEAEAEDWAFNPRFRASVLQKWANLMRENFDRICTCLSLESGKPLQESRIECNNAIGYMEYAVASARTLYGSTSTVSKNRLSVMTREPVGVVVGIEPWNYPITLMVRDSIPALAAGETGAAPAAEPTEQAEESASSGKGMASAIAIGLAALGGGLGIAYLDAGEFGDFLAQNADDVANSMEALGLC